jgi:hypothetical protein
MAEPPSFARFMRPATYAVSRDISLHTLRYWIRLRIVPSMKIGRLIALDPVKVDAALLKYERKAVLR